MTTINKLNYDCLAHIFEFFGPKEWLDFSKVCKKWNTVADFLWKDSFKICCLRKKEFEDIVIVTQTIEFQEIVEIMKKTVKLKHVSLLYDENVDNFDYMNLTCYFGNHAYFMTTNFEWKSLIHVIINMTQNLHTLKIERIIAKNEIPVLKKLFKRNQNLITFKINTESFGFKNSNLFSSLPNTLENVSLKFCCEHIENYNQMLSLLDKQLKLKHVHIKGPKVPHEIMPILLRHKTSLKSLSLQTCQEYFFDKCEDLRNSIRNIESKEFIKNFDFINLEKIHLQNVNDEVVSKILQICPKIKEVKLDCILSKKVLTSIMSKPELKTLCLYVETILPCPVEMKHLHLMRLTLIEESFNFESLIYAINQMPRLTHLTISSFLLISVDEFFVNSIFTIINLILFRGKYVVMRGYESDSEGDDEYLHIPNKDEYVAQVEFYMKDSLIKSKESRFTLAIDQNCFDPFYIAYSENVSLLPNCKAFKRNSNVLKPLFENNTNSDS